jgi:hypothetical protein
VPPEELAAWLVVVPGRPYDACAPPKPPVVDDELATVDEELATVDDELAVVDEDELAVVDEELTAVVCGTP